MKEPERADAGTWVIVGVVAISNLLSAFGGSSVNVVLPLLQQDLQTDLATIGLALAAYQVTSSGLMLGFGRLGDLRGHRRIFLSGIAIFAVTSVIGGLAPNVATLLLARIGMGVGTAMLWSTNLALVAGRLPRRSYGRVFGILTLGTYLGLSGGPIVAGILADAFGWRSVFLLAAPTGAIMLGLVLRFLPPDGPATSTERFDGVGAALLLVAIGSLIVGLDEGSSWGWTSPAEIAAACAAVIAVALFVVHELRAASPMLDLRLFKRLEFSVAATTSVLNYMGVSVIGFLLPYYLIQGRGLGAGQAGLIMSAQPIAQVISAPLSGIAADRFGARLPTVLALGGFALGLGLLALMGPDTPLVGVGAALALAGLGTGAFSSPNSSTLLGAAPRGRQGTATGIQATTRNLGFALGVGTAAATMTAFTGGGTDSLAASDALFPAVRTGLAIAAALAALGAALSALRPSRPGAR